MGNNVSSVKHWLNPAYDTTYGLKVEGTTWVPTRDVKLFSTGNVKNIKVHINGPVRQDVEYDYDTH